MMRAGVQQGLRHQARQPDLLGQALGLRQVGAGGDAGRVHQRAADQQVHQLQGDGVHHHRAEDLVDLQAGLEDAGDEAPDRAGQKAHQQRAGDQQPAGPGAKGQREPGAPPARRG